MSISYQLILIVNCLQGAAKFFNPNSLFKKIEYPVFGHPPLIKWFLVKSRVADPDPDPDWIRIQSGQGGGPGSGFGIRIRIRTQESKNDPKRRIFFKVHVFKYWMASFES